MYQLKKWAEAAAPSSKASTIIYLSKSKEKDGKDVIGNIIKAKAESLDLSKENQQVSVRLYYDERGLDRYFGLLELGEAGGMWKNVAEDMRSARKYTQSKSIKSEKYFTAEVLEKLGVSFRSEFSYGS